MRRHQNREQANDNAIAGGDFCRQSAGVLENGNIRIKLRNRFFSAGPSVSRAVAR
jgi:hypothetical protein